MCHLSHFLRSLRSLFVTTARTGAHVPTSVPPASPYIPLLALTTTLYLTMVYEVNTIKRNLCLNCLIVWSHRLSTLPPLTSGIFIEFNHPSEQSNKFIFELWPLQSFWDYLLSPFYTIIVFVTSEFVDYSKFYMKAFVKRKCFLNLYVFIFGCQMTEG